MCTINFSKISQSIQTIFTLSGLLLTGHVETSTLHPNKIDLTWLLFDGSKSDHKKEPNSILLCSLDPPVMSV